MTERWIALAEVARPHGVRGELRLRVFNADSDLLLDVETVRVNDKEKIVDYARRANEAILMKLRGVDDRDVADTLRGAKISLRRDQFPELEEGEFYVCDVEGARVVFEGKDVGKVTTIRSYPSVEAMVVEGLRTSEVRDPPSVENKGELEIPLTDAFIERVDVENGVVVLRAMPD